MRRLVLTAVLTLFSVSMWAAFSMASDATAALRAGDELPETDGNAVRFYSGGKKSSESNLQPEIETLAREIFADELELDRIETQLFEQKFNDESEPVHFIESEIDGRQKGEAFFGQKGSFDGRQGDRVSLKTSKNTSLAAEELGEKSIASEGEGEGEGEVLKSHIQSFPLALREVKPVSGSLQDQKLAGRPKKKLPRFGAGWNEAVSEKQPSKVPNDTVSFGHLFPPVAPNLLTARNVDVEMGQQHVFPSASPRKFDLFADKLSSFATDMIEFGETQSKVQARNDYVPKTFAITPTQRSVVPEADEQSTTVEPPFFVPIPPVVDTHSKTQTAQPVDHLEFDQIVADQFARVKNMIVPKKVPARKTELYGRLNIPDWIGPDGKVTGQLQNISIEELTNHLRFVNPEILISGSRELGKRYDVDLAKTSYRPTVAVEASGGYKQDYLTDAGPGDGVNGDVGLTVTQQIYDFGLTDTNVSKEEKLHASAQNEYIDQYEDVVFEALSTLVTILQNDALINSTQANLSSLTDINRIVQQNYDSGNSTVADLKRVEGRVEAAKNALIGLKTERASSYNRFKKLTKLEPEWINTAGLATLVLRSPILTEGDLNRNPEILALNYQISALKDELRATNKEKYPTFTWESAANYEHKKNLPNSDKSDLSSVIRMSVDLYDGGRIKARKGQLLATLKETEFRLVQVRNELEEEALNAATFDDSHAEKTRVLEERVAALEQVATLYQDQFGAGLRTIFELLESEYDLLNARNELIVQRHDHMRTSIQKLNLSGRLVESINGVTQTTDIGRAQATGAIQFQ